MKSTKLPAKGKPALPANVAAWFALLTKLDDLRADVEAASASVLPCPRIVTEYLDNAVEELLNNRPTLGARGAI